jgi:hypothetical protein
MPVKGRRRVLLMEKNNVEEGEGEIRQTKIEARVALS